MAISVFHTELQEILGQRGIELQELIHGSVTPAALEKKWLETFSEREFAELGISRYFPRMARGLPRLYRRYDPSQCQVKHHFAHLPSLKRLGVDRVLLSLYDAIEVGKGAKISVFTWVMSDGWGDLIAGWEAIRILQERFHQLEIRWVVLLPEKKSPPELKGDFQRYWLKGEVSQEALAALRTSDCILQLPTYYPKTQEVIENLKKMPLSLPLPQWIEIGEYGFLESDWFHPKSGRYSMGLHCLEKGILIHKSKGASFAEVKNEQLLLQLFGTLSPGPSEMEKYHAENSFYFAYLSSFAGGTVYLQALLKAHERDEKRIDLCTPHLGWVIELLQEQKIKELQHLQQVEIYFEGQSHVSLIGNKGKKLRILCPGEISDEDFRSLVRLSGEFVGVRGDQSFSEAVSANKVYFYDGREHAQYFIRDLAALAENRIGAHRNTLAIFRAMRNTFLYNLPPQQSEWVEEFHFQERTPLIELGLQIGLFLQDPDAIAGFKKLGRIIAEEYSANEFLCHLVQKELCHLNRPDLKRTFDGAIEAFASGRIDFGECFFRLASDLHLEKKFPLWKIRHVNSEENHDLHARLGKALRALIHLCAREEIRLKADEIGQLAAAIGGPLAKEAETLSRHLKSLLEISKQVADVAFHLEQESREL